MLDQFLAGELSKVETAVREAAAAEILPHFQQIAAHEISEKSGPHDLVTVADRGAEEHLTAALSALLPGSVVVGEEAVQPTLPRTTRCAVTHRCGSSTRSTAPASSSEANRASARWWRSPTGGRYSPPGPTPPHSARWPSRSGARAPG